MEQKYKYKLERIRTFSSKVGFSVLYITNE